MSEDATLALRSVGTPWLRSKVFWYVKPSYRGRVLIRGRRLDAPGTLRFGEQRLSRELRIRPGQTVTWDGQPHGGRGFPSAARALAGRLLRGADDGTSFSPPRSSGSRRYSQHYHQEWPWGDWSRAGARPTLVRMENGVELRGVTKRHGRGGAAVVALDAGQVAFAAGTLHRDHGPVGLGQVDAAAVRRRARSAGRGTVSVDGVALGRLGESGRAKLRRERIGFVFQAFNLLPALTAEQNVALPLRLAGRRVRAAELRARWRPSASRTAPGTARASSPAASSSASRSPARCSAAPAVLFADEPTGALDTASARGALELLRGLSRPRRPDDRHGHPRRRSPPPTPTACCSSPTAGSSGSLDAPTPEEVAATMTRLEAAMLRLALATLRGRWPALDRRIRRARARCRADDQRGRGDRRRRTTPSPRAAGATPPPRSSSPAPLRCRRGADPPTARPWPRR